MNEVNGATEALGAADLTALAVAVLPMHVLEEVIVEAVQAAHDKFAAAVGACLIACIDAPSIWICSRWRG